MGLGAGTAAVGLTSLTEVQAQSTSAGARKPRRILESRLAGYPYHEADEVLASMKRGDALWLRANPSNPHDAWAVEVWWRAYKLGYIPRTDNASVAQLLAAKEPLIARIEKLDATEPSWDRIHLSVYMSSGQLLNIN